MGDNGLVRFPGTCAPRADSDADDAIKVIACPFPSSGACRRGMNINRVEGAGVIGMYPVLVAGAPPFVYASQTLAGYPTRASGSTIIASLQAHASSTLFTEDDVPSEFRSHFLPSRLCGIMQGAFRFRCARRI